MALDTFNPYLFVSAGEQSNKFLTPTYAGGIAQFQAQRAQSLTGLTVRIDPIQEGSGDPSPENIRPISGRTGLTVTCAVGKNMLPNGIQEQTTSGVTFTLDKGKVIANGTATATIALTVSDSCALAPGDYILTGCPAGGAANAHYKIDIVRNGESSRKIDTGSGTTFTVDTTGQYTARIVIYSGEVCDNLTFAPMVRLSGESADYAPYTGAAVYPVTWESIAGTVYGGTLDVVSGVLTVTHAAVNIGSLTWSYVTASGGYFGARITGRTPGRNSIASCYLASNTNIGSSPDMSLICAMGSNEVYIKDSRFTVVSDFVAAVGDQTICYPLATPQTYQLTPTDVKTLAGFNQIYSDAGPVIDIQF